MKKYYLMAHKVLTYKGEGSRVQKFKDAGFEVIPRKTYDSFEEAKVDAVKHCEKKLNETRERIELLQFQMELEIKELSDAINQINQIEKLGR